MQAVAPALKDHPRIRGEKRSASFLDTGVPGSPPHTRGKDFSVPVNSGSSRITPAYAGKRKNKNISFFFYKDHPRIRGEKHHRSFLPYPISKSPPHTRGKVSDFQNSNPFLKITPAYAGKRQIGIGSVHRAWDHPRIRGEKSRKALMPIMPVGSPPHTRGKVAIAMLTYRITRITPAYAGKSHVKFSTLQFR